MILWYSLGLDYLGAKKKKLAPGESTGRHLGGALKDLN